MPNNELLQNKIDASGMTITAICDKASITRASFYNKITGKREWKASELKKICDTLNMTKEEFNVIFFN